MKFIYDPLVLLWLSIFGQVVLWFGQAKYTLYLSQGTSELKRKFLALQTGISSGVGQEKDIFCNNTLYLTLFNFFLVFVCTND